MEDYNESSSIAKMNLVEQELCSRSVSFDWLSDEKRDLLPGPIAFEYKRLREYTEKGNVEASLWKLVNLANVTLMDLITNYCDLYRAEGQPEGNRKDKLSKKASETLRKVQLDRSKKTDAETFERLKKEIEGSGLQYIE